ncbi:DUF5011 domain-containing protein [Pedobacter gandavensis]|uniref:DUF5011 domain-containing protein n=1 Tax=Pedobacter gandavensis TaxID=2679963 RepID=UPI00292D477A|nr:DUF5011 domain-containing protein [Pedobacter gandavensis]
MKKYLSIIVIGILAMTVWSCKKESFDYPPGMVGISKVTFFPIITMKGEKYFLVAKGTAFTDPGATAKAGSDDAPVVASGAVNTAVAGIYGVTYSAVNADGFSATVTRQVIVYDTKADAAARDLSGKYLRNTNSVASTWKKIGPGVYLVANPGGAVGADGILVVAVNPTGSVISIPQQNADSGSWSSLNENYDLSTNTYSWVVINAGYGDSLRFFVKQ